MMCLSAGCIQFTEASPWAANLVKLVGGDGNAFGVLRHVIRAMQIRQFREEATAGDYDHLQRRVIGWVEAE